MASVSTNEKTGRRRILFVARDGKRKALRLGRVTQKQAETVLAHVEELRAAQKTGSPLRPSTADWVATMPETIRNRAERLGLIVPRERVVTPTLAEWLKGYIGGRTDLKPNTLRNLGQTQRYLLGFFGSSRRLAAITPGDADEYRVHLKAQGLSEGTIRRECKRAKQVLTAAVKKRLLSENPFAGLRCGNYVNAERFYFVKLAEVQAVIEACPDAEWRLIFALARFGGLRCPSEVLALKWADVNWEHSRFTVRASKTEHHDGGGVRQVPIFPELMPCLRDCFEQAEPGQEYVIATHRGGCDNLRTQLKRIVERAGLVPWPKLFQNCRSTRETELTEQFPVHVVCKWIGNSQPVAAKHYLQVTEAHFEKAAQKTTQNPAQQPSDTPRKDPHPSEAAKNDGEHKPAPIRDLQNDATACGSMRSYRDMLMVPPRGVEPLFTG